MRIFRVRGKSLTDALKRARAEHGMDALVLGQEPGVDGGVELAVAPALSGEDEGRETAARDSAGVVGAMAGAVRRVVPRAARPTAASATAAVTSASSAATPTAAVRSATARTAEPDRTAEPHRAVGRDWAAQRDRAARSATARGAGLPAGRLEVERRLRASGCSAELVRRTSARVARRVAEGAHPIDAAAEALAARFEVARSARVGGATCVVALVGPPGAGKTLALAKLAGRLAAGGRRVALATCDARPGAVAELSEMAEILDLPLHVVRAGKELGKRPLAGGRFDVVLLDTPGVSPASADDVERLRALFAGAGRTARVDCYLVLPATSSAGALDLAVTALAPLKPSGCIVTHLDGTRQPAAALERASRARLPIAFLGGGTDLDGDLHRATRELCADVLLRGGVR